MNKLYVVSIALILVLMGGMVYWYAQVPTTAPASNGSIIKKQVPTQVSSADLSSEVNTELKSLDQDMADINGLNSATSNAVIDAAAKNLSAVGSI